ncbi:GCN5-like N-acetyltransferase [Gongronella butleri]|nr:GCN5-like N-acetyltransferase [Gongronella butleri]
MPIQLRPATDSDHDLLVQIHVASWKVTYKGLVPDTFLDDEAHSELDARWKKKHPLQCARVRHTTIAYDEASGESVGFVYAEYEQEKEKDMVYVDHLHVLPNWQGHGIGKMLLKDACDWTRSLALPKIYLYVMEQNAQAIQFYERQKWIYDGDLEGQMSGSLTVQARRYVLAL